VRTFEPDARRDLGLERPRDLPPSARLRLLVAGVAVAVIATAALLVLQLAQH
jgi:hypothetical protein